MERSLFRRLGAFAAAVIAAAALGSVVQTQFNLAFIAQLGVEVPLSVRLRTTAADLVAFAPLFAALVAAAFAIGFAVAELVARRVPDVYGALFAVAGGATLAGAILLLNAALPMTPIAATRGAAGTISLAAAGVLGGLIYRAVRNG